MAILEFNLLPEEFRRPERVIRLKVWGVVLVIVAVVLIVFFFLVYTGQTRKIHNLKTRVGQTQHEIAKLQESVRLTQEVDKLREGLEDNIFAINSLANQNADRVKILQQINTCVPSNLSLVSLEEKNATYLLTGYANSNLTVARFIDKLNESQQFRSVTLTYIKPSTINGLDILSFELSAVIGSTSTFVEQEGSGS